MLEGQAGHVVDLDDTRDGRLLVHQEQHVQQHRGGLEEVLGPHAGGVPRCHAPEDHLPPLRVVARQGKHQPAGGWGPGHRQGC